MAVLLALVLAFVLPFRIDAGPYAGSYRFSDGGAVNWYFASTALLRLPHLPLGATRAYLDAYLAHLDPTGGIADALPQPSGIFAPIAPDSEDAYAATMLSLAAKYRDVSHDDAWWNASVATLESVAYAKLLTQVKDDGLIRASQTDATGYLMDNAEDYAALRAFAAALRATHHPDAAYVHAFVAPLGAAIDRLYDPHERVYRWSDSDPPGPLQAYPSCAAQLYPELDDVRSGTHANDVAHRAAARQALRRCSFDMATSPHEALLYAVYITYLASPTRGECAFARDAERARSPSDLTTTSLRAALHDGAIRMRCARVS